jgi:hypothetical protein
VGQKAGRNGSQGSNRGQNGHIYILKPILELYGYRKASEDKISYRLAGYDHCGIIKRDSSRQKFTIKTYANPFIKAEDSDHLKFYRHREFLLGNEIRGAAEERKGHHEKDIRENCQIIPWHNIRWGKRKLSSHRVLPGEEDMHSQQDQKEGPGVHNGDWKYQEGSQKALDDRTIQAPQYYGLMW